MTLSHQNGTNLTLCKDSDMPAGLLILMSMFMEDLSMRLPIFQSTSLQELILKNYS